MLLTQYLEKIDLITYLYYIEYQKPIRVTQLSINNIFIY